MKKILSMLLCITLAAGTCMLSGCTCSQNTPTNSEGKSDLSGKEIAKLLLANERLDSNDLSVGLEDSIAVANASIGANKFTHVMAPENAIISSSTTTSGNTVSWSDFSNECNTYDFFESYFNSIETSAQIFAELIDQVKQECGNTDYWINAGGEKVFLRVEANQETIFVKSEYGYKVCRRYTNEDADNVYEMYSKENDGSYEERMLYIAGKRYEFSNNFGGYEGIYIVAENTRGYWNMFQVTDMEKNRCNIMNFVSTGSMAFTFDNSMIPDMPEITEYALNFSATDLSNDIVTVGDGLVDMNIGAFNGIDHIEAPKSEIWDSEGSNSLQSNVGTLVTTSGKKLSTYDSFENQISINAINADFTKDFYGEGNHRTSGHVILSVPGETCAERMNNFKAFLSENGMSCKYNLDAIVSKYASAQEIARNFKYTYKWNGYSIKDYAGIENAVKVERAAYSEFAAMYDEVKDIKTVETTSFGKAFEGWDFSKIDSIQCGNVGLSEEKITVENMSVVMKDTAILDTNEKYTVSLALAKFKDGTEADYDNAVIMQCEGADITSFDGGDSITLSQSATFTLPRCAAEGRYTVVAYVATEDGIRVSEMVPVIFSEDIESSTNYDGFKIDYKTNEAKEIRIECAIEVDVYIKPEDAQAEYTYDEMYELLKQGAASNGFFIEGASIEAYDGATDTSSIVEAGAPITSGVYRMEYIKQIGDNEVNGYIYFEF
ncbi:MAG: hypothetical protein IJP13_05840 [Lachnospiraceae bacterium]|nr:hypothetical protein [Lachnospiraceae bacterium]